jgi:hypothetical protein
MADKFGEYCMFEVYILSKLSRRSGGSVFFENAARHVLYLDFDGVLHDEEVYSHPELGIYLRTSGRRLFEWEPILVELLAPHPHVRIVLSTSWVPMRSFNYARSHLTAALKERVIGATFHQKYMQREEFMLLPRGLQIVHDASRRRPEQWFAIDDDDAQWPKNARSNLILTNGSLGIGERIVQDMIAQQLEAVV